MRIGGKICRLLLCVMGLMLILPFGTVLAQEEKIDLTLRLVPGGYYKKVTPGEENIFYLEVHNAGNKPITGIRLSSDGPEGWVVKFMPVSIDYLGASSVQTVDVSVKPASNAAKDEYQVNIIAEANETRRVISAFLRVETVISLWLWVGVAVAALVVAGFVIIYRCFGRQ